MDSSTHFHWKNGATSIFQANEGKYQRGGGQSPTLFVPAFESHFPLLFAKEVNFLIAQSKSSNHHFVIPGTIQWTARVCKKILKMASIGPSPPTFCYATKPTDTFSTTLWWMSLKWKTLT